MKYNPDLHHRKSYRLKGYDYSQNGLYFITICTYQKECLFGEVTDGIMLVNDYGKIVENELLKTMEIRKNIKIHNHVIMPNHIHFILEIINPDKNDVGATPLARPIREFKAGRGTAIAPTVKSNSIGSIVGQIKSLSTKKINQLRKSPQQPLWQKNYYDNIIRNDEIYLKVFDYIDTNPLKWTEDKYNEINMQ